MSTLCVGNSHHVLDTDTKSTMTFETIYATGFDTDFQGETVSEIRIGLNLYLIFRIKS